MKKLIFILVFLFSNSLFANLVDEVDKLTPEEANLLIQKLDSKFYQPLIPETFFTRITVSASAGTNFSYPREYNNNLNAVHDPFKSFYYGQANLMWYVSKKFMIGFMFQGFEASSHEELTTDTYQKVTLSGYSLAFACGYLFDVSSSWYFTPAIGIGPFFANSSTITDNDLSQTTYDYSIHGVGYVGILNLSMMYRINRVFSIGPEISYQYARVDKLKRFHTIETPKNIIFNGLNAGIKIAYNY